MKSALTWGTHWTASTLTLEWKKQLRLSGYCSLSFESSLLSTGPPLRPESDVEVAALSPALPRPAVRGSPRSHSLPAASGAWAGLCSELLSQRQPCCAVLTSQLHCTVSPLVLIYCSVPFRLQTHAKSNQNPAEVQVRAVQQTAHQCLPQTSCTVCNKELGLLEPLCIWHSLNVTDWHKITELKCPICLWFKTVD